MKDFYTSFIKLSLMQCTKHDYADKQKVRRHNAAVKKLNLIEEDMKKVDCTGVLTKLLQHEDDRVRINAASFCLQTGIVLDEAKRTLDDIAHSCTDPTIRFCAEMLSH